MYAIAFWHMAQVNQAFTALKYATQLEETMRLVNLLRPVLPNAIVDCSRLLPFMSAQNVGDILYKAIWPCVRSQLIVMDIPSLAATATSRTTEEEKQALESECKSRLSVICQQRSSALASALPWQQALDNICKEMGLLQQTVVC